MPIVSGGGGGGGGLGAVTLSGVAASGQAPIASSANAATWGYPPSFEINYTERTTSINIVSLTEAAPTVVLSPGAITFDGTPVQVEFYSSDVWAPTAATVSTMIIQLYEGATVIARLYYLQAVVTAPQHIETAYGKYRFTPTAAAHTYTIGAFVSSTTGTPLIDGGSGGVGSPSPCWVRFSKA